MLSDNTAVMSQMLVIMTTHRSNVGQRLCHRRCICINSDDANEQVHGQIDVTDMRQAYQITFSHTPFASTLLTGIHPRSVATFTQHLYLIE